MSKKFVLSGKPSHIMGQLSSMIQQMDTDIPIKLVGQLFYCEEGEVTTEEKYRQELLEQQETVPTLDELIDEDPVTDGHLIYDQYEQKERQTMSNYQEVTAKFLVNTHSYDAATKVVKQARIIKDIVELEIVDPTKKEYNTYLTKWIGMSASDVSKTIWEMTDIQVAQELTRWAAIPQYLATSGYMSRESKIELLISTILWERSEWN